MVPVSLYLSELKYNDLFLVVWFNSYRRNIFLLSYFFFITTHLLYCRKCPILLGGKASTYEVRGLSTFDKFQIKIKTAGTYENFVLKSIVGFFSEYVQYLGKYCEMYNI